MKKCIIYLYEWFISKGRNEVHKIREEQPNKIQVEDINKPFICKKDFQDFKKKNERRIK